MHLTKQRSIALIHFFLIFALCIGIFFRFLNINWGAPFYFHPDERNIIHAVTSLNLTESMNPHFFAYGSIPLYVIYSIGVLFSSILSKAFIFTVEFSNALLIGRILSAIFSVGTIFLTYKTSRLLMSKTFALLAAFFVSSSVGLIQYAHFGTFESYLTFFSLLLFYYSFAIKGKLSLLTMVKISSVLGVLVAIKISSLVLLPLPLLLYIRTLKNDRELDVKRISVRMCYFGVTTVIVVAILFIILNPYALIDFSAFRASMEYESAVGTGALPVFYTNSFINTIPFLYHMTHIFPFVLNPFMFLLCICTVPYLVFKILTDRKTPITALVLFFLFIAIPQAILFVKWTRYMIPTLPFIYMLLAYSLCALYTFIKKHSTKFAALYYITVCGIVLLSIGYAYVFMKHTYLSNDTRILAAQYATQHLPPDARLLSEVYDLGIIPFNNHFRTITLFDFYALDHDPAKKSELEKVLQDHDYMIVLSQRIEKSRIKYPSEFPEGYSFYSRVHTQYTHIYTTPCDTWCTILYMGIPGFATEDTINVFDRPQVSIYKIKK